MINQVVANPDYTSTSNQYGFYALPKTLKPKTKYRQDNNSQNQDEEQSNVQENPIIPLEDAPQDQKNLQRDYFVDEAPWPQFKPKQAGKDIGVQIQDQQLFDFQSQVQPLLQILIGQSIVKARNQLQQQKQINQKRKKLAQFQKKRNAELMVTQRLQNQYKRKVQQSQRRKLQNQIYKQQKKIVTKKIIAFNQSKKALAGLRNQVLYDLEQQGLLRHDMYVTLRTQFQPWLYDQIVLNLKLTDDIEKSGQDLLKQKQREIKDSHKKNINKQNQRRQAILDQRQRQRLQNDQRKRKKKIKKQRQALHNARIDKFYKLQQIIARGQKIDNINKAQIIDNLVKSKNSSYISGGAFIHLLQILQILTEETQLDNELIQQLLLKILSQRNLPFQINIVSSLRQKILALENQMKQQFLDFYNKKNQVIENLVQQQNILNNQFIRVFSPNINANLLRLVLNNLLKIYFTYSPPEQVKENPDQPVQQTQEHKNQSKIVLNDQQKRRLAVRNNILITSDDRKALNSISQIIRIRFPLNIPEQSEELHEDQQGYIQVFDGEGWKQKLGKYHQRQSLREPVVVNLNGFERAFVYDEISEYNFNNWILNILTSIGLNLNRERLLSEFRKNSKKYQEYKPRQIPIYDIQVHEQGQ